MTLFCVSFSINAKAVTTKLELENGGSWNSGNLKFIFSGIRSAFPSNPDAGDTNKVEYDCSINVDGNTDDTVEGNEFNVILETEKSDDGKKITYILTYNDRVISRSSKSEIPDSVSFNTTLNKETVYSEYINNLLEW